MKDTKCIADFNVEIELCLISDIGSSPWIPITIGTYGSGVPLVFTTLDVYSGSR